MSRPIHGNLLVRVLAAIGAVLVTGFAIFVGAMAFLAFLGLAIIAFVAFQLRMWWLRRRMAAAARRRRSAADESQTASRERGRTIEGEYSQQDPSERDR